MSNNPRKTRCTRADNRAPAFAEALSRAGRGLLIALILAAPAAHADVVFEITEEPDGIRATVVGEEEENRIDFFSGETQQDSFLRSDSRFREDADSGLVEIGFADGVLMFPYRAPGVDASDHRLISRAGFTANEISHSIPFVQGCNEQNLVFNPAGDRYFENNGFPSCFATGSTILYQGGFAGHGIIPGVESTVRRLDGDGNVAHAITLRTVATATLTVVHEALPADGSDFDYSRDLAGATTLDPDPVTFTLDDADPDDGDGVPGSITFADDVVAGTYEITETVPAGWAVEASCAGGSDAGSLAGGTLTVDIAPREAVTCTFTHTRPDIGLAKTITGGVPYTAAGETITYTLTAENTGTATLDDVTVTDPDAAIGTCTPASGSSLAATETMTCEASYTVTQADVDAGSFTNTATVSADDPNSNPVEDSATATATADQMPALGLTKTVTGGDSYAAPGDVISYELSAANTGNVTLANVTVSDPDAMLGTCTPALGSSLAPAATMTCDASYTVTQGDVDAGRFTNTASTEGTAPDTSTVNGSDSATASATQSAALDLAKTVTGGTPYTAAGDVISYDLTVTNTGNVTLDNVTVSDPDATLGTCAPAMGSSLAPAAGMTCEASYTVTRADVDAGSVTNTATAGSDQAGPVTDQASVSVASVLVTVTLSGGGQVVSGSGAIDCPGDCQVTVDAGTVVTLNAVVSQGTGFEGWENCPVPDGRTCTVPVEDAINVTALFVSVPIPALRLWGLLLLIGGMPLVVAWRWSYG